MSSFNSIVVPSPKLSKFKLRANHLFDCDAGQIIPFLSRMLVPGDFVKVGNEIVVRMQPQVAPTMHEISVETRYFAVPLRLLFGEDVIDDDGNVVDYDISEHDFLNFMTGGKDGTDTSINLPRWVPTGGSIVNDNWNGIASGETGSNADWPNVTTTDNGVYSLWDYFGLPTGVNPDGAYPLAFPRRAYNLVYNYFFRDQNLQNMVSIDNNKVLNACWKKDYFTSALPFQQRGLSPSLPVNITLNYSNTPAVSPSVVFASGNASLSPTSPASLALKYSGGNLSVEQYGDLEDSDYRAVLSRTSLSEWLNSHLSATASTFDVKDLRLAFQIQKWMERSALSGVSTESQFLLAHYGVAPRNDTIQIPQFLGGSKSPVIISEVLQTSSTDGTSPQGNMAGHGLSADSNFICKYHANEFCWLLGVMVIRPKNGYSQGIDRELLYRTRYDFFDPLFVNLSEQAVEEAEIFAQDSGNVDENDEPVVFGYQGRYNELRTAHSKVCGGMKNTFDFWHLYREFSNAPNLNSDFVKCNPSKRIFAVETEPGFIVNVGNFIDAYRPLPSIPTPGLVDHH